MQRHLRVSILLVLVGLLCLPFPCSLYGRQSKPAAAPSQPNQIILEPNKGTVITTKRPISAISIANPELADAHIPENQQERQVLLFGKGKSGETNLIVWYKKVAGEEVDPYDTFEIRVSLTEKSVEQLSQALEELAPDSPITVHPDGGKGVILTGEVDGPEQLDFILNVVRSHVNENFTNLINVHGSQQVQLSVRIAEVSRSNLKQMGLGFLTDRDWSIGVLPPGSVTYGYMASSRSRTTGTSLGTETTTITDSNTGLSTTTTSNVPLLSDADMLAKGLTTETALYSPFSSAFQLAVYSLNDNFLGILSVLKGQNLAKILASPTLVTMSGQEANFLVGGEFPIPMSGDRGQTTINYKNYGIMLRFTPTVVAPETITVQVNPEISSIDYSTAVLSGGVSVPGLKTRRASTTLQLKDGQTFVMAGLLNEEMATAVSKVPLLGDIPYLGTLFTSKEFQKKESELMIIVTPHLVRALNPGEVPKLPGEGTMDVVSDGDFFLNNQTEAAPETNPTTHKQADELIGGSGFAH
ncbi:type II and III secretion system protein family protein [Desulfobulbus elongatus]|uniref:type II and III secretion system protein family protein n=1 Tax=Desulfobulbus elongatus TaxID=53332 RepID=UPI000489C816|nr:type II and III secretion system protein family protein [Desulfobulbus elongatus]